MLLKKTAYGNCVLLGAEVGMFRSARHSHCRTHQQERIRLRYPNKENLPVVSLYQRDDQYKCRFTGVFSCERAGIWEKVLTNAAGIGIIAIVRKNM